MPNKAKDITVKKTPKKEVQAASPGSLLNLRDAIDDVFDRFFADFRSSPLLSRRSLVDQFWDFPRAARLMPSSLQLADITPRTDVEETDNAYIISAELPGIDEKNVSLELIDDMLTLKGEKSSEREEKKKDYHLSERSFGSFSRSFRVPGNVDVEHISADFSKGVLKVTLPKAKAAQKKSKKINVKAK